MIKYSYYEMCQELLLDELQFCRRPSNSNRRKPNIFIDCQSERFCAGRLLSLLAVHANSPNMKLDSDSVLHDLSVDCLSNRRKFDQICIYTPSPCTIQRDS